MIIILTFIAFTGLVALISWYKTKEENLSTKEGYFLAGRGLTGLVIAGSLEMTNLSTEQLVGQAGQSYSTNMGAMSWSVNASIALLALALIFLPKYLKAGITTIPEFLEVRFDRTTKQIISFLFLLGYMLTYLPTVLYSGALAFNQIFHLDQLFGQLLQLQRFDVYLLFPVVFLLQTHLSYPLHPCNKKSDPKDRYDHYHDL